MERAYAYLGRLSPTAEDRGLDDQQALCLPNPLDGRVVLMPGEHLPVALEERKRAWILFEDGGDDDDEEWRGTLARVVATCPNTGGMEPGGDDEPSWPRMVVVVATNRCYYDKRRRRAVPVLANAVFVGLLDLRLDVAHANRNLREMILRNMTSVNGRLERFLHLGPDESTVRNQLVEKLRNLSRFQAATDLDDLDLKSILALARSLIKDQDRLGDEDAEIARILSVLGGLGTASFRCRWCGLELCQGDDLLPNRFALHCNRYGSTARLILSKRCGVEEGEEPTSTERLEVKDSWFEGYGWVPLPCPNCNVFAGFKFRAVDDRQPSFFYGFMSGRIR